MRVERPDGAVSCKSDADCDDGVDCTRDTCLDTGYCASRTDNSRCSDGVFCNGQEWCDAELGCRPGRTQTCDDDDVCTIDRCDEAGKRCAHDPRDFDGDGEADWHCAGGTDCDDFDATRSAAALEVCNDGIDNDCDDEVDEKSCGRASHDRCDDALDIGAGGTFEVDLAGAAPDYTIKCGEAGARDVAFVFTTTEAHDVTLTARGLLADGTEETASIAIRKDCADIASEVECGRGFPAEVRRRALPPGRYFAIVNSEQSTRVVLDARFEPPTATPSNTSCKQPLDISAGGRFSGDLVDVGDDETVECGFDGSNDLVYSFTLDSPHDVELSAISATGERMNFALRTSCGDPTTTLRCVSDAPARARVYQLPAGTYYVLLESSPSREVDFDLDVAFLDPTEPPPGDGCENPLELPLSEETQGTLANRQDLLPVICHCTDDQAAGRGCNQFLPDVTYRVTLDEASDLGIELNGGPSLVVYDFRSSCEAGDSQLACDQGALVSGRIRDLAAGTYYLVIESNEPANFTVKLDPLPRTMPVPVDGNNTCAEAIEIPEDGGLWSGDTLPMLDTYEATCGGNARSGDAAFHLMLSQRSQVKAALEGTFDTVLYRFTDPGAGAASCVSGQESACNDDGQGNTNSELMELLDPGSYYYVVDGFNTNSAGKYLFEVAVTPE